MKDSKVPDKDKEKMHKEYSSRKWPADTASLQDPS